MKQYPIRSSNDKNPSIDQVNYLTTHLTNSSLRASSKLRAGELWRAVVPDINMMTQTGLATLYTRPEDDTRQRSRGDHPRHLPRYQQRQPRGSQELPLLHPHHQQGRRRQ